jgi:hypothetical protein
MTQCAKCKTRPKHRWKSGLLSAYCRECWATIEKGRTPASSDKFLKSMAFYPKKA